MADLAAVLNADSVVVNMIVFSPGTDLAPFNAVAVPPGTDVDLGWSYINGQFVPPPFDPEAAANAIRSQRDLLLYQCDWTMLPDAPPEVVKADWEVYRQALRNVTDQPTFPESVVWPTPPFVIGPV